LGVYRRASDRRPARRLGLGVEGRLQPCPYDMPILTGLLTPTDPKTRHDPALEMMRKCRFRYLWENMAKSRRINLEFTQMLPYLHSQELRYLMTFRFYLSPKVSLSVTRPVIVLLSYLPRRTRYDRYQKVGHLVRDTGI
jgi:hypothetical protein